MHEGGIPAWILCEDVLVKLKEELGNEAIMLIQKEVKAGRMKVEGRMVSSEAASDAERDLFVASEIAKESAGMLRGYSDYILAKEASPAQLTAGDVEKMENVKRLMLAVSEIAMLMDYRRVAEEWILEIEGIPQIDDPSELLASTMHGRDDERFRVLEFALSRKSFIEDDILSEEEKEMLGAALELQG